MWRISTFFLALSLGLGIWLVNELSFFSTPLVMASDKDDGSLSKLMQTLDERSHALDQREADIVRREKALSAKDTVFTQQVDRYERIISDLKAKLSVFAKESSDRATAFRQLYEKMDAKKAAQIFNEMDMGLATEILNGMKQDHAAEILGDMDTVRARQLTERYLKRRMASQTDSNQVNDVTKAQSKGGEK